LNLDNTGHVLSISDTPETGTEVDINLEDYDFDGNRLQAYQWNGAALALDEAKLAALDQEAAAVGKLEQIASLKAQLASTDYICCKIVEGVSTPADYADVLAQRQTWRAQIDALGG
jgi:hypothetical protein